MSMCEYNGQVRRDILGRRKWAWKGFSEVGAASKMQIRISRGTQWEVVSRWGGVLTGEAQGRLTPQGPGSHQKDFGFYGYELERRRSLS